MRLYVLRHGSAEPWLSDDTDFNRNLSYRGEHEIQSLVAEWRESLSRCEIWVSPYCRTQQTAERLLGDGVKFHTTRLITPDASLIQLLDLLPEQTADLLLISHQPLVSALVAKLSGCDPFDCPMSPASLAVLEGDVIAAGCMDLVALHHV